MSHKHATDIINELSHQMIIMTAINPRNTMIQPL